MAIKFLDLTGLTKFWNKCKSAFVAKDSSGNVAVVGNLAVDGNLSLKKPINFQDLGATFGDEIVMLNGYGIQFECGADQDVSAGSKYATIECGTDGNLYIVQHTGGGSPIATHTYVSNAVTTAVANAGHLKREKVDVLPGVATAKENVIYMVPNGTAGGNKFDEYMLLDGAFEKTGSSDVDLSGYSTTTEMNSAISSAISAAHTAITATEIEDLS